MRHPTHVCRMTNAWTPNNAHYMWHKKYGGMCYQAMMEKAAAEHVRLTGSLEGWEYNPHTRVHSCEDREDFEVSDAHYKWHYNNETEACRQSRKELAAYTFYRRHGTIEGWKYRFDT